MVTVKKTLSTNTNIDLTKIRPEILNDVLEYIEENYGFEVDKREQAIKVMVKMSKYEVLDTYLRWNGIIGWTDSILRCLSDSDKAGFGTKLHSTISY